MRTYWKDVRRGKRYLKENGISCNLKELVKMSNYWLTWASCPYPVLDKIFEFVLWMLKEATMELKEEKVSWCGFDDELGCAYFLTKKKVFHFFCLCKKQFDDCLLDITIENIKDVWKEKFVYDVKIGYNMILDCRLKEYWIEDKNWVMKVQHNEYPFGNRTFFHKKWKWRIFCDSSSYYGIEAHQRAAQFIMSLSRKNICQTETFKEIIKIDNCLEGTCIYEVFYETEAGDAFFLPKENKICKFIYQDKQMQEIRWRRKQIKVAYRLELLLDEQEKESVYCFVSEEKLYCFISEEKENFLVSPQISPSVVPNITIGDTVELSYWDDEAVDVKKVRQITVVK